jgi:hypothetical protein
MILINKLQQTSGNNNEGDTTVLVPVQDQERPCCLN